VRAPKKTSSMNIDCIIMFNMKRLPVVLAIAALQCCSLVVDSALSTIVDSGEEECFVVRAPDESMIR
jgi:hypothetical protein